MKRLVLSAVLAVLASVTATANHHLGHVQTAADDTPNKMGYMPLALAQAGTADQHAGLAVKAKGDTNGMKLHAKHVRCSLTVDGCPIGTGYPGRKATAAVAEHIGLAAEESVASANLKKYAPQVAEKAKAAVEIIDQAVAVAVKVENSASADDAAKLVDQIGSLTAKLVATLKEADVAVGNAAK